MKRIASKDIDSYLADVPKDARTALEKLRKLIKATAPKAVEVISYQIPSFKYNGMLVGFAAFKEHCSFFVMSTKLMRVLKGELKPYSTATATIHFTPDKPLPVALIKKIVKARVAENDLRMRAKANSKSKKAR
jgi:uncharacterized protein YdhG (YjbR/CyaY superfamily)